MKTYRIQAYKEAKGIIDHYMKNKKDYAIIHYSCQGFDETQCASSPRITAICIMLAKSKQVTLFSLASIAERNSVDLSTVGNVELDQLERELLQDYYAYLKSFKNQLPIFLHWNMKDQKYGFAAIDQRYRKLKSKTIPFQIGDDKKINIASLLKQRYGENYVQQPRMEQLLKLNNILPPYMLEGKEEPLALKKQEYMAIERSVQEKVQVFHTVLERMANNELKTEGKLLRDVYGFSIPGIITYVKEHAVFGLVSGVIIGLVTNALYDWIKSL